MMIYDPIRKLTLSPNVVRHHHEPKVVMPPSMMRYRVDEE